MVQKRSGRPRQFDPNVAALAAMEVFWEKGYEGASLDDLTRATGINRPSLYNTFGDKRELFLASLNAYSSNIASKAVDAFEAEPNIEAAVRVFFQTSLSNAVRTGDLARGCLVGTAAVASVTTLEGLAGTLQEMSQRLRNRLIARFDAEKAAGTLRNDFPSNDRAALVVELMQGQAHRARIGDDIDDIAANLDVRIASVLQ